MKQKFTGVGDLFVFSCLGVVCRNFRKFSVLILRPACSGVKFGCFGFWGFVVLYGFVVILVFGV